MMREPPPAARPAAAGWLARSLPRLFRLTLLAAIAGLLHLSARQPPAPGVLTLADARRFFPEAHALDPYGDPARGQTVRDAQGGALGSLLTTSPHTDDLIGYSGPSNLLVALNAQGQLLRVEILTSGDTQAHVEEVKRSADFWKPLLGWQPNAEPAPHVEGVSGSTLTSLAMVEGVNRRLTGSGLSLRFPEPVTLDEVRALFPQADELHTADPRPGWHRVTSEAGQTLGYAVRTSPASDNVRGYQGPTEMLVAVSADRRRVLDVRLRKSYDTPEYVDRVREDEDYRKLLSNRTTDEWAQINFREAGIEGVSGATQTSFAVAEGVRRRFAADRAAPPRTAGRYAAPGLIAIIAGALALTFTPLRTQRRVRWIWNGVLVLAFAWWLGDLLSLALLVGWARHGIPWRTAPAVLLLVAVTLVVPWATRRNIYCQHLCPHGAAQAWLGRFKRLHVRLPTAWNRWLTRIPAALLIVGLGLALFVVGFDLAWLEPFDAWVLKGAAAVSAAIAVVGLVASLFVPQAYCRFGCPTGELLRYIKSGGSHDRLERRDWIAGLLLVAVGAMILAQRIGDWQERAKPVSNSSAVATANIFSGSAFGTRWSVKFRTPPPEVTQTQVAAELERIESTLSHWRPDSAPAQFNASETTFATEQPAELVQLAAQALELSRATNGAYDITVAPLVSAWGFGPDGEIQSVPTEQRLQELLQFTGWEKLTVDREANTLRKAHPKLQIDLGSLLQGYAADCIAKQLAAAGVKEFLIDVGGELVARGEWTVAIENPNDPSHPLQRVQLKDQALATSGLNRSTRRVGNETVHHLISPKTGRPFVATARLCAIIAQTGREADAWATALLAVGLPDASSLANEQGLAVLWLDNEGRVHVSERGRALFNKEEND